MEFFFLKYSQELGMANLLCLALSILVKWIFIIVEMKAQESIG